MAKFKGYLSQTDATAHLIFLQPTIVEAVNQPSGFVEYRDETTAVSNSAGIWRRRDGTRRKLQAFAKWPDQYLHALYSPTNLPHWRSRHCYFLRLISGSSVQMLLDIQSKIDMTYTDLHEAAQERFLEKLKSG